MATWMYQLSPGVWSPERYRFEIWEGERWAWRVGRLSGRGHSPSSGDVVVFFHTPSGGADAGFYGWAVVLEWLEEEKKMYFRPCAPSNHLKMHPWWDSAARKLADEVRGKVKQGTMWHVSDEQARRLREGITSWLFGA